MLPSLSNQSTIWIFQANRILNPKEIEFINSKLALFIPEWAAHGTKLKAEFEVLKNLFVLIGVDENQATASGCSKDALNKEILGIGAELGVDFFDRLKIAYVNENNEIVLADMATFKTLIQKDIVRQNTFVYNNLVSTKEDLINHWEVQLKDSWHANLMPIL
ncbi:MAG: ABC transporter ATPase [Putridiphycobacter sp.]|nr:ABC transporter ATPase [Putridiphycobacter sp.]